MDPSISCFVLCLVLNLIGFSTLQKAFYESLPSAYHCQKLTVQLTVSPIITPSAIHYLQLSWNTQQDIMPGDFVALYQEDPTIQEAEELFRVPVNSKEGWVTSDVQQNKTNFQTLAFSSQCLGYWIAYRNVTNSVLASSCLRTEPRWMETHRMDIKNLTLKELFIPGTHNSGSYIESEMPFYETIFHKYVYTQDESTLNQLIYGVRYLDLRVGYYPNTKSLWWSNHDLFRVRPLKVVLDDIILFVNMTKEIVILDVHRFPVGFKQNSVKVHTELQDYLISYLGDKLVPVPSAEWSSTLRSIWNTKRQIILSYNKRTYGKNEIWSPVNQKWANTQSVGGLKQYLDGVFESIRRRPWVAMTQLTPLFLDIVTDRPGGLRKMADAVNRNVTRWFQSDFGKSCNVVAVDFLKSTGIVQAAIDWNRRRALGINC